MNPGQKSTIQRKWRAKAATHAAVQQAADSLRAGAHTAASQAEMDRRFEVHRRAVERDEKALQNVERAMRAAGIRG